MCNGLFDALKRRVEIEGASLAEDYLNLYEGMVLRYAAARGGYEGAFPDVGSEERCCDMSILEGKEGR